MRKIKSGNAGLAGMTLRNRRETTTVLTGSDGPWPSRMQQNLDSSDFLCYMNQTCR
jgi:hypothetical protein